MTTRTKLERCKSARSPLDCLRSLELSAAELRRVAQGFRAIGDSDIADLLEAEAECSEVVQKVRRLP